MYAKKIITIFADQICKQYASRDKNKKQIHIICICTVAHSKCLSSNSNITLQK